MGEPSRRGKSKSFYISANIAPHIALLSFIQPRTRQRFPALRPRLQVVLTPFPDMALFDNSSPAQLQLLLRLGFAARLRSETADIFVSQNSQNILVRTSDRSKAAPFFFLSGDTSPHEKQAYNTAVLCRPAVKNESTFLSLLPSPSVTGNPTLLKVRLVEHSQPNRVLFSICNLAPLSYLSLSGVKEAAPLVTSPLCNKWAMFHLEVLPNTIGKGSSAGAFNTSPSDGFPYLTIPQAISSALLELGVRFRLRSVHRRVLRRDPVQSGTKNAVPVLQNGPKTSLDVSHDQEILLEAFRVASNGSSFQRFALQDTQSSKYLLLYHENSSKTVQPKFPNTAAVLQDAQDSHILIKPSPAWGVIHVGLMVKESPLWLMAGPRGRLELRSNPGAWESFSLEFVRQSYDALLSELPVPGVYKVAEETTKAAVRSQIVSRVAAAKGTPEKDAVGSKGGFDHSKALAGLSNEPSAAAGSGTVKAGSSSKKPQQTKSTGKQKGSRGKAKKGTTQGKAKQSALVAASAAAASSSLPRNKANRKAAKKNKNKKAKGKRSGSSTQQKNLQTKTPAKVMQEDPASSDGSASTDAPQASSSGEASSNASDRTTSESGPPCAACGRAMTGTYTTAFGKGFHPTCFCCGKCRRPMGAGAGKFRERGGTPYCDSCYATHVATRCARCSQPIMETVITAMEKSWHKNCLTCTICRLPLTETFWLYADKPNEPRCNRCVTGEEQSNRRHTSGRAVNLPGIGRNSAKSFPTMGGAGAPGAVGASGQGGRARLMSPVLPPSRR